MSDTLGDTNGDGIVVWLPADPADIKTVNNAWKSVECRHFKDPTTACLDCQATAVLAALHQKGWRKTQ